MLTLGLAYLPEDRDGLGLITRAPIAENVTLPILDRLAKLGFIDEVSGRKIASEAVETYSTSARPASTNWVSNLSGGNRAEGRIRPLVVDEAQSAHPRRADGTGWTSGRRRRFIA